MGTLNRIGYVRGSYGAMIALAVALAVALLPGPVASQDVRWGDSTDPVLSAIDISQRSHADGAATFAIIGRADVFADNLAATPLAGPYGTILYTDGGPDAPLRPEVLAELERVLMPRGDEPCEEGFRAGVYLVGGEAAVSPDVQQTLEGEGYCVRRLAGASRVETSVAIADEVGPLSETVLLARGDNFADAAAVSSYASRVNARILITPSSGLPDVVVDALIRYEPSEIILLGGEAALSADVEAQAAEVAPTLRLAGEARDETAVAIADALWDDGDIRGFFVGHGYASTSWTFLFAAGPYAARWGLPILYADGDGPTDATQARVDRREYEFGIVPLGPAQPINESAPDPEPAPEPTPVPTPTPAPGAGDLSAASVGTEVVASVEAPLAMRAHPTTGELWVAQREGVIRTIGGPESAVELDISDTVSTNGERGLLGFAFSPDADVLYTSSTNNDGDSVLEAFDVVDGTVDMTSRRLLLEIAQPASNHNGGDLQLGPDGMLWWAMGDGGGSNDAFGQGQRADTLLAAMLRIDPTSGDPYGIPADNPFADGQDGAAEVWAYGLRNPWRFAFDPLTDDLYIADVGQGEREEIDFIPAGTGAGSNFGWPIFEGTQPFAGGDLDDHAPPIFETDHADGNCSITGGVVYRGDAIPELRGAYLFTDLCNTEIRAIQVQDGEVAQTADLGIRVGTPVSFGVDSAGEVYVLSLGGDVVKLIPG